MADSKLNDLFGESMNKIKELAGTETVIGEPIFTPNGTTIIPVSKISMGFASGGIDYVAPKPSADSKKADRFGGGGGTGVSITPIAFLILSAEGKIDLIPITAPQNIDTVDKIAALIERSPDILQRLKDVVLSKKQKKKEAVIQEDQEETEVPTEE